MGRYLKNAMAKRLDQSAWTLCGLDEIAMALLTQFQAFDPVSGYVPKHPFSRLPEVASRSRSILSAKTAKQIDLALKRINSEFESFFSDLKFQAVDELTVKFQNDPETYQEFFEWDGGTLGNGRWLYRNDMDEELDIPTAQNSSEVEALKTIIENRDSCFFLPVGEPVPEPDHWPEGRTHELFAVLALGLLANCLQWASRGHGSANLSIAGECALEAMDAVCFAEHLREVEWLEQFHKKQLLEASISQATQLGDMTEKVRMSLIEEQIAHERAKQATRSEQMNAARHQSTNETKELVCKDWEKAFRDFASAEKAGNHYATWLEKKSIGYLSKGKQVFYQPRAVTGWIRQYAKEKGIRFR